MANIIDFLQARISEDEAAEARKWKYKDHPDYQEEWQA